jgi:hypothetical protein
MVKNPPLFPVKYSLCAPPIIKRKIGLFVKYKSMREERVK